MTASSKSMKMSTRLLITLGSMFVLVGGAVIGLVNYHMRQYALEEAEAKARIILDRNMATHTYFSHQLKPALFEWSDPFRSKDYFEPVWMSSTYAVRQIEKYFKSFNPGDYYYKNAAINARSPENEATDYERLFIRALNTNQKLENHSEIHILDGRPYFITLRRGSLMESACLRCHSTPDKAPKEMVDRYGARLSFNRKLGEWPQAVSVRIPLSAAYSMANQVSIKISLWLLGLITIFITILFWFNKKYLFDPLSAIRDRALTISSDDKQLGIRIPPPSSRELNELTIAFNSMSFKLRCHMDQLEKRVEERAVELSDTKSYVDNIIRSMADTLIILAPDFSIQAVNQAGLNLLGYEEEDLIGKKMARIITGKSQELFCDTEIGKLTANGSIQNLEKSFSSKNGNQISVLLSGSIMRDKDGRQQGVVCIAHDISARKQVEQELRFHAEVMANMGEGVHIVSAQELIFIYTNPKFENMLGYDREELIGRKLSKIYVANEETLQATIDKMIQSLERDNFWQGEVLNIRKDRSTFWNRVHISGYDHPVHGKVYISVQEDITARRKAERELEKRRVFQEAILECTANGIVTCDREGVLSYFNKAAQEFHGLPLKPILPEEWTEYYDLYETDGKTPLPLKRIPLARALRGEKVVNQECMIAPRGFPARTISVTGQLLIDSGGNRLGALVSMNDITAQKKTEKVIVTALKEKGILLSEIHHRVKNNMQVITSLLKLQAAGIKDKKYAEMFRESRGRIRTMALIHEKLYKSRDFSKIDVESYIKTLCAGILRSYGATAGHIALTVTADGVSLGLDHALPCGLIINELVSNSLKHAFSRGEPGEISVSLQIINEDTVELIVSDNGVGLPRDFDIDHSKSMGMEIVKIIAEHQLEGSIELNRTDGTAYCIHFRK